MMASTDMSSPVTRGELRAEIEQYEIRLDQKFANLATKADLEQGLANLMTKADLEIWGERLLAEFARHTRAIEEALSMQISEVRRSTRTREPARDEVFGPKRR